MPLCGSVYSYTNSLMGQMNGLRTLHENESRIRMIQCALSWAPLLAIISLLKTNEWATNSTWESLTNMRSLACLRSICANTNFTTEYKCMIHELYMIMGHELYPRMSHKLYTTMSHKLHIESVTNSDQECVTNSPTE